MFAAYVVVTVLTAVANLAAAVADFVRVQWILDNMSRYGIPHSWILPLGVAKAVGALGLLVGFAVPAIGVAAAVGLVGYFVRAVGSVTRARCYADLRYPASFLVLAVAALALRLATL
ncbi:DoxX-like family protein [Amycolatopsis arida]|uniref:DoxX-like family protein n=1 Tax=Amycolatopsis arida TaxID=587909 RepID=A0A1I6A9Z9_9PSEU|nr:DoxX family protein [Amycolatopsis arida]TDX88487.1 DoxX-like protein [Amycolatopsis arida]SFQ65472.1 DoxX-like family protein [Amycolatopsis arida]